MPVDPGLDGRWAMFWFEDPVVVDLRQDGNALGGTGCCAGIDSFSSFCCGSITGTCDDAKAKFSFELGDVGGTPTYGTAVYISEDEQRMGGSFSVENSDGGGSLEVAWVRLQGDAGNLGSPPQDLYEVVRARQGIFELVLSSEFVGRFEPLEPYSLTLGDLGFIRGAFGPFYWGEMRWDAASQTLTVGPVPATDPSFATELALRFDDATLVQVIATYPDEPPYFFHVMPPALP
jgi:hypothetical protein